MIIITTRPQSMQLAIAEWQKYEPAVRPLRVLESGVVLLSLPGNGWEKAIADKPRLIFTRHMFQVGFEGEMQPGKSFSIQVRRNFPQDIINQHRAKFLAAGMVENTKYPDWVLSIYSADDADYIGFSRACDNRSRWSGGAAHYKNEGIISRAQFKLIEAMEVFGLNAARKCALDLGAAPGGWTKALLDAGAYVTAVDPGALHPSLNAYKNLNYICATAERFFAAYTGAPFEMIVNDMKMEMYDSARIMLDAAHLLAPGGNAVMTVKLSKGYNLSKINKLLRFLEQKYYAADARQLFHNRDEITVALRRK